MTAVARRRFVLTARGLALEQAGRVVRLQPRRGVGYVDVTDPSAFDEEWARAAGDATFADFFDFVSDPRTLTCAQAVEAAERGELWPIELGYVMDAGRLM